MRLIFYPNFTKCGAVTAETPCSILYCFTWLIENVSISITNLKRTLLYGAQCSVAITLW